MDRNLLIPMLTPSACLATEEIGSYLRSGLPAEQLRRVENHLLDCPLCSDAVDAFSEAPDALAFPLEDFTSFQKKLPSVAEDHVRRLTPGRWVKRAISVAALLAIGVSIFLFQSKSLGAGNLYDRFYSAYENDISLNLRNGDTISPLTLALQKALDEYSARNYSGSIIRFEEALREEPDNDVARFFAGMACLESGLPDKAVYYFYNVADRTGNYSRKAQWYLILSLVKMDRRKEAKALLAEFLKNGNGYKSQEAVALQSSL